MIPVVKVKCFNAVNAKTSCGSMQCIIDSGAAFTYATADVLSILTGFHPDVISNFIDSHCTNTLNTASGNVSTSHVFIRNVRIGTYTIPEFHMCASSVTGDMFLLGMDFINACKLTVDYGEASIDGFNQSKYLQQLSRYKDEAYEILHMSSPDELVFDEYCKKFSIPIETRSEELRRLLNMFGVTTLSECSDAIKNTFLR